MSLSVTIEGTNYPVRNASLDQDPERFGLYSAPESESRADAALCYVRNSLKPAKEQYKLSDFRVALFTHKEWPESYVFSLKEGERSIGLIFSLQALASGSRILQTKRLWNDYGLLALAKLCAGDSCSPGGRECIRGETYEITELYSDDTVVAIFVAAECAIQTGELDEFCRFLYDRIPSFVRFGLFLQNVEGSQRVRQYRANGLLLELAKERSNLRIRSFAFDFPISSKNFLIKLLAETDPYEKHPAFRFFLYYQVIESLLQVMFDEYYVEFVRLASDPKFNRATAMKDLVAALQAVLKENVRLKILVSENSSLSKEFGILRDHCVRVLDVLERTGPAGETPSTSSAKEAVVLTQPVAAVQIPPTADTSHKLEDAASALYDMRNALFHSFMRISSQDDLEELVDQFSMTICDLAVKYTKPKIALSIRS